MKENVFYAIFTVFVIVFWPLIFLFSLIREGIRYTDERRDDVLLTLSMIVLTTILFQVGSYNLMMYVSVKGALPSWATPFMSVVVWLYIVAYTAILFEPENMLDMD